MIGNSNDEANFRHKLSLTNRQVSNLCKAFTNDLSANTKLSKNHLSKITHSGGFLGRLPRPWIKTNLPLMKNLRVSWYS